MEILKITKKDFLSFIDEKITEKKSRFVGVVKKDATHYVFDDLETAEQMHFDYDVTILPPKKYFQPPKEVLLKFKARDAASYTAQNNHEPITIIGIHYYDLAAIHLMDRAFADGEKDENYIKKRENSLLIGIFPAKHFKYRFSRSVVRGQYYKVADLMLVDMGNNNDFAIEVVSSKGKEFLEGSGAVPANYSYQEIEKAKNSIKDDQKLPVAVEVCPEYLTRNYWHPAWEHFAEKCFSCGSCVLVCPTCYCFDVQDEIELTLAEGKRVRTWDGCMLEDFAQVADGHNFRKDAAARFRHRIFRKGKFLPEKYRHFGCVGCGRCADACTADIAGPVKVFKYISENQ